MAPHQPPVSLSDDQLGFVMRICEPMLPADRSAFLQALAELLQTEPQPVGDGNLYKLARDLRSRYWRPPTGVDSHPRQLGHSKIKARAPT